MATTDDVERPDNIGCIELATYLEQLRRAEERLDE